MHESGFRKAWVQCSDIENLFLHVHSFSSDISNTATHRGQKIEANNELKFLSCFCVLKCKRCKKNECKTFVRKPVCSGSCCFCWILSILFQFISSHGEQYCFHCEQGNKKHINGMNEDICLTHFLSGWKLQENEDTECHESFLLPQDCLGPLISKMSRQPGLTFPNS